MAALPNPPQPAPDDSAVRIRFENLEELQTRLVLLPRVEEEGTGAVVLSLTDGPNSSCQQEANSATHLSVMPSTSLEDVALEEPSNSDNKGGSDAPRESLEGYELLGLEGDCRWQASWRNERFEDILAAIRQAPAPFTLCFIKPQPDNEDDLRGDAPSSECEEKKEDDSRDSSSDQNASRPTSPPLDRTESSYAANTNQHSPQTAQLPASAARLSSSISGGLLGDLSVWTTRVKASSSAQLAAATTTGAALLAQAKERAAVARLATTASLAASPADMTPTTSTTNASPFALSRETSLIDEHGDDDEDDDEGDCDAVEQDRSRPVDQEQSSSHIEAASCPPPLGLYVHASSGAWTSLCALSSTSAMTTKTRSPGSMLAASLSPSASATPDQSLTNSSLLAVRVSSTQACVNDTAATTTFQWYRSAPSSQPKSSGDDACWTLLNGATHAAFQPTAFEVGHRLRCVVTIRSHQAPPQAVPSETTEDVTDSSGSKNTELPSQQFILETECVVHAALPLFNGARQALGRTAQFAGLSGRGKLEGRSFLLKVGIGKSTAGNTGAAVTIYQVSGRTAEPVHAEESPFFGVAACLPDYGNAKILDIVFTRGVPDSAPMVQALATDDGRFELEAPNRMSRESLLLAIGVANFTGRPMDLDQSTILFGNRPHEELIEQPVLCRASSNSSTSGLAVTKQTELLPPVYPASASTSPISKPADSESLSTPRTPLESAAVLSKPQLPTVSLLPPAHKRSLSLGATEECEVDRSHPESSRLIQQLQEDLRLARAKLDGKNKVVSELQRSVARAEASLSEAQQRIAEAESTIRRQETEHQSLQQALRLAEKKVAAGDDALRQARRNHEAQLAATAADATTRAERIADLEKTVRTLQNDKAVLSATVEAREGKLANMATLQQTLEDLSAKVARNESLEQQIAELQNKYNEKCDELSKSQEQNASVQTKLDEVRAQLALMMQQLDKERSRVSSHQSERDQQQIRIQKLLAERNSYKHKSDSLGREMARVCRDGRSLRDVERILAEDSSRTQEIEVLREQKKKATEELQRYQVLYEQARRVQLMAGLDCDAAKVLERNEELERLLSELTEYVSAKEMQLQTLKDVNDALQTEIRDLAKASMNKNDV